MTLTAAARPAGLVNPSLVVQAMFATPFAGDLRKTRFDLRQSPEVAAWLLSFLDHFLSRQAPAGPVRPIAEPPGGAVRERLVHGKVILTEPRAGGGVAIRLNPVLELGLYVKARVHGEPARETVITLGENPELSRWLLSDFLDPGTARGPGRLDPALEQALRRLGALVDEPPPGDVCFPPPGNEPGLAAELETMVRTVAQPAGAGLPAEVREVLGRHAPALPPATPLLWGEDAGTGLVFPVRAPPDAAPAEIARLTGRGADGRAAAWERQLEEGGATIRAHGYAVLRGIIPPAQQVKLRRYVRALREHGYFPPLGVGDTQVERRTSIHTEPTIASLHNGLARLFSRLCGEPLLPSFSQLGIYEEGAILEKHRDRPQCVYNLSLIFDMYSAAGEPAPWPLYLEVDGKSLAFDLAIGDGLVYRGSETTHWRDPLPAGQQATAAFFFFVRPGFTGTLD